MDIRSLEELREADERTLRFSSRGFETGGKLRPEDAAAYQQEVISRLGRNGPAHAVPQLHSLILIASDPPIPGMSHEA